MNDPSNIIIVLLIILGAVSAVGWLVGRSKDKSSGGGRSGDHQQRR